MHQLSIWIAEACVKRNWIQAIDMDWCIYAVETKLLFCAFLTLGGMITWLLGVLVEASVFVFVFCLLRSHMGGWHAPFAWLCQIISLSLVLLCTLILGPAIQMLCQEALWGINIFALIIAYITKPVFPVQMHATEDVLIENAKIKNDILLLIFCIQVISFLFTQVFVIYSFLGILFCVISIIIQPYIQKSRREQQWKSSKKLESNTFHPPLKRVSMAGRLYV